MFDDFDLGPQCEEFYNDLEIPDNIDDDEYWDSLDTMLSFDVGAMEEE